MKDFLVAYEIICDNRIHYEHVTAYSKRHACATVQARLPYARILAAENFALLD